MLSGKCVSSEVEADASVESLKRHAQSALLTGRGRLLNSSGETLDGAQTIKQAELKSGDVLTLHVNGVQLQGTTTPSPHSWVMDLRSLGVSRPMVATVVQSRRS